MNRIDVAHLTFTAPWLPGSYNRLVGAEMRGLTEFSQVAVSYGSARPEGADERVILVGSRDLSITQALWLRLPARIRQYLFTGFEGKERLAYAWALARCLPRLRPRVVVCYDSYKLGPLLRNMIDWPCRLVFSQHGLSYYLPTAQATNLYSLRSFDAVWVLTHASYRADRQRMPAYEPIVTVIPNGIDTSTFRPPTCEEKALLRGKHNLPANTPIVLLLSRLVPKKGAHAILYSWSQILAKCPDAFLWVVGGGDSQYQQYLRDLVANQPSLASSVRFEGAIPPEDVSDCFRAADVYVFPTLFCEGMGLSLAEAMATGLPSVVADYEIGRELFSEGEVLFVSDPNLEDAFVDPVVRLLANPALRQELGARGRAAVQDRFDEGRWLNRLRGFYSRQLSLVAH